MMAQRPPVCLSRTVPLTLRVLHQQKMLRSRPHSMAETPRLKIDHLERIKLELNYSNFVLFEAFFSERCGGQAHARQPGLT